MARGSWNKQHVVQGIHKSMDNFKYEVARELGIPVQQGSEDYWGAVSSRDCGAVGGQTYPVLGIGFQIHMLFSAI
ncbi:MAG: hypothetical protein PWR14_684 [Thermosediminibacterales bacterium]|jgi:hypothetical protein|nr:hypothetical protein [Thermosediminibacterales bacterium]